MKFVLGSCLNRIGELVFRCGTVSSVHIFPVSGSAPPTKCGSGSGYEIYTGILPESESSPDAVPYLVFEFTDVCYELCLSYFMHID
jgi:hypothetical protein